MLSQAVLGCKLLQLVAVDLAVDAADDLDRELVRVHRLGAFAVLGEPHQAFDAVLDLAAVLGGLLLGLLGGELGLLALGVVDEDRQHRGCAVRIDASDDEIKQLADKARTRNLVIGSVVAPVWPPTGGGSAMGHSFQVLSAKGRTWPQEGSVAPAMSVPSSWRGSGFSTPPRVRSATWLVLAAVSRVCT